ncbi:MAG: hypothetical protein JTT11_01630 [Candidatus Brockarchaeota archaeon]|nr:hypothetical protein [Candidatus Brockarchaeota archaeon]
MTAVIIKHTNPCGVASGSNVLETYECDTASHRERNRDEL